MKRFTIILTAGLLAITPFAAAQTQTQGTQTPGIQTPGAPGQRNPALAATFDLVREVNGLSELNKSPKTAITRAQAQKLLPILKGLQTAKTLPPATATRLLTQIEDTLSDPQLTALDALALKRQQGFRPGGQAGGQGRPAGAAGQGFQGGQFQGGQGGAGQGSAAQRRQPGGNPFLFGRMTQGLNDLVKVLTLKAK